MQEVDLKVKEIEKKVLRLLLLIKKKNYNHDAFNNFNTSVFDGMEEFIPRKDFKNLCVVSRTTSTRGFQISLKILEALEIIRLEKVGVSLFIKLTDHGKEAVKKIFGGNKKCL